MAWRRVLVGLLALAGMLAVASPASAHLDLASSSPATGTTVAGPLSQVTLTFTAATSSSAATFTVYDRTGSTVPTTSSTPDDGVTWVVTPTAPLEDGPFALTWSVAAADAHPMQGTVSFSVAAAAAAPAPGTAAPAPALPSAVTSPAADVPPPPSPAAPSPSMVAAEVLPPALAAAVAPPDRRPWEALGVVGRWVSYAGALVAVGALLVTLSTLVGSRGDVALAGVVVRVTAAGAVVGGALEAATLVAVFGAGVPVLAAGAAAARVAGGGVLVVGAGLLARRSGGRRSHDVPVLAAIGARGGGAQTHGRGRGVDALLPPPPADTSRVRAVAARPALVVAGGVLLGVSFLLDGHTASEGPWLVMAGADLAHVAAAATWIGGVVLLAALLIGRARIGVPTGAGELAVRFSVPATAAAAAVGVTGSLLALLIVDTPVQLVTTPWGRLLLLKLAVVAVVAGIGYVNNRYAVPALDAWRPGTARMLRRTVLVEALIMLVVVAVTAFLVAARI